MKYSIKILFSFLFLILLSPAIVLAQKPTYGEINRKLRGKTPYEVEKICISYLSQIKENKSLIKEGSFVIMHCLIYDRLTRIYTANGDYNKVEAITNKIDSLDNYYYGEDHGLKSVRGAFYLSTFLQDNLDQKIVLLIKRGNLREAKYLIDRNFPSLHYSPVNRYNTKELMQRYPYRVIKDTIIHKRMQTVVIDTVHWTTKINPKLNLMAPKVPEDGILHTYTIKYVFIEGTSEVTKTVDDHRLHYYRFYSTEDQEEKIRDYDANGHGFISSNQKYTKENTGYYRVNKSLGMYYNAIQKRDSSIFYYEKYIVGMFNSFFTTTDLDVIGRSYLTLSELRRSNDQPEIALKMARKGHKLLHHRWSRRWNVNSSVDLVLSTTNVAESYRKMHKLKKAFKWSNKASTRYAKLGEHKYESIQLLPYLANRAMLYWEKGNLDSAYAYFTALDQLYYQFLFSNFSYLSEHERFYTYSTTIQYLDYSRAFYLEQVVKGTALKEKCSKNLFELNVNTKGILLSSSRKEMDKIYSSNNPEVIGLYDEIKVLKNMLSYPEQMSESSYLAAKVELDKKENQLTAHLSIRPEEFVSQEQILKEIPDSAQLIDILKCYKIKRDHRNCLVVSDSSAYVYYISKEDKSEFVTLFNTSGNVLDTRIYKNYNNSIRMQKPGVIGYDNYWRILLPEIKTQNLILNGDGIYNLINPLALYDGENYLIDKYTVYTVFSAKEVLQQDTSSFTLGDLQLVGRPDFSNFQYTYSGIVPDDLPGTEKEVYAICSVMPAGIDCDILTGTTANENTIKQLNSPTILHMATHGYFENISVVNPLLNSGLLFSITDTLSEDGHLTAYEASNLDLKNTSMVVLSACETGRGTVMDGEGVWGLRRSFQTAGVRYVVMSMFKVSDEVTAKLMLLFYTNLSQGQSIPLAFRNAEKSIKGEYPDPLHWGAFVLIGY